MIKVGFTSPDPGSPVGPTTFTVTGSWYDDGQPDGIFDGFYVTSVGVALAPGGASVWAALNPDNSTFSAELTLPADTQHGDTVTVTCGAGVVMTSNSDPGENGQQSGSTGAPLDLVVEKARNLGLTWESFASPVITPVNVAYRLKLKGTATDAWNKIRSVKLKVDDDFVGVDVDSHVGVWFWEKTLELPAGQYILTVTAEFDDAEPRTMDRVLTIREPYTPDASDQDPSPITSETSHD